MAMAELKLLIVVVVDFCWPSLISKEGSIDRIEPWEGNTQENEGDSQPFPMKTSVLEMRSARRVSVAC